MSIEETDDVVTEHEPVSAGRVHDGHPRVEDPVRQGDVFPLVMALAAFAVVVGLLIFGITAGAFVGVR